MNKKYEHFTNNELAMLNRLLGNEWHDQDDDRMLWMWQEIAMELDRRNLKDEAKEVV